MVDINENELYLQSIRLRREFRASSSAAEIADIRDEGRMRSLIGAYRPQDVFHAAAHKHVPLMESGAVRGGEEQRRSRTWALARIADESGVERFVYISTDKAVRPTSVMGARKRVGEMVVGHWARRSRTRFTAVRFGNVLASAGSVVPIFREQIAGGGPVTVTHPEVRRYFMTIAEAVGLVLQAGYGDYGELCVLDMGEQIRIAELARHMITMAGLVPTSTCRSSTPGCGRARSCTRSCSPRTRRAPPRSPRRSSPRPARRRRPTSRSGSRRSHRPPPASAADDVIALIRELVPSYQPSAAIMVQA